VAAGSDIHEKCPTCGESACSAQADLHRQTGDIRENIATLTSRRNRRIEVLFFFEQEC
jgi:hypothetical protein